MRTRCQPKYVQPHSSPLEEQLSTNIQSPRLQNNVSVSYDLLSSPPTAIHTLLHHCFSSRFVSSSPAHFLPIPWPNCTFIILQYLSPLLHPVIISNKTDRHTCRSSFFFAIRLPAATAVVISLNYTFGTVITTDHGSSCVARTCQTPVRLLTRPAGPCPLQLDYQATLGISPTFTSELGQQHNIRHSLPCSG